MSAVVARTKAVVDDTIAGEGEVLSGDASAGRRGGESRGLVPAGAGDVGVRLADCLIVKEGEDLIFPDGAADAAAEMLELVSVSGWRTATVVALKGVEVRLVGGEEEAAVNVVGAALGSDLKLSAAEAAIL